MKKFKSLCIALSVLVFMGSCALTPESDSDPVPVNDQETIVTYGEGDHESEPPGKNPPPDWDE